MLSSALVKKSNLQFSAKYDSKYDIVKFVSSLLVLAIHCQLYPMVLYPWLRVAVPLFFIMSSFFLFGKLQSASEDSHKTILKKFVVRNLQLYLCWLIILFPVTIYFRRKLWLYNGFFENALNIVKSVFFESTFKASWFITATVIGALIIYFLDKKLKNNYLLFLISIVAFSFVTLASSYKSMVANTFLSMVINKYLDIFGSIECSYLAAIFWVFIGKLFAEQKIKFKSVPLLVILTLFSCVALFLEWKFVFSLDRSYSNDSYFMLAPLCILLFICIEKIPSFYWDKSIYLKHASTIIYVVHASILPIVSKLLFVLFKIEISLVSFVVTFICCIVIYIFIEFAVGKCRRHSIKKVLKMLY